MDSTALDLSRFQFALTAAFHVTFPAVTVGLSVLLTACYAAWMRTRNPAWLQIYRFWKKIFAVGFGLGVVAGVVLTFEFGLNWGGYASDVGPILGVIIGMEVVTAFFLEAGFLGLMLYGDGRVSERVQLFATAMVSVGTLISTTWILAANSWMQTPAGFTRDASGQFRASDWWRVIFNDSFVWRYPHMLLAVLISASWFVAGVGAYYLLKGRYLAFARRTLSIGLGVMTLLLPIQMFVGDNVAKTMATHQPSKGLATEGDYDSTNTGYNVFIIPDQANGRNRFDLAVPCMGSVIVRKDYTCSKGVPGLLTQPRDTWPDEWVVFYAFRVMFFGALLMFAVAVTGVLLRLRRRLYVARWFHRVVAVMLPAGVLAIVGGWVTAEAGRQPWVVYGQLRTADAVSPLVGWQVVASVVAFLVTYAVLLTVYVRYVVRVVKAGPEPLPGTEPAEPAEPAGQEAPAPVRSATTRALAPAAGN